MDFDWDPVSPSERSPLEELERKEVTITSVLCLAKEGDRGWILTFQLYSRQSWGRKTRHKT